MINFCQKILQISEKKKVNLRVTFKICSFHLIGTLLLLQDNHSNRTLGMPTMRGGSLTYTGLAEMVEEKLHGIVMVTIEEPLHSVQFLLLCLSGKRGRVPERVAQQLPAECTRAHNI